MKQKYPLLLGLCAGLTAGGSVILLMLLLRLLVQLPTAAELLAERLTLILPVSLFGAVLGLLESAAKRIFFVVLLFVHLGIAGVLGMLIAHHFHWDLPLQYSYQKTQQGSTPSIWRDGMLIALVLWAGDELLFLPAVQAGFAGSALTDSAGHSLQGVTLLGGALLSFVYGIVLTASWYWLGSQGWIRTRLEQAASRQQSSPATKAVLTPARLGRRKLLRDLSIGLILAAAGGYALRWWLEQPSGPDAGSGLSIEPGATVATNGTPELVSAEDFYVVSKNVLMDPVVDSRTWSLQVDGNVASPFKLNLEELRALPAKQQIETITCISNKVGGHYIGNSRWTGVPLRMLLERASPKPGTLKVVFSSADGYSDSISLQKALEGDVLVAYEMEGRPLLDKHGAPARMLVPNIYGMKHAKWLTHIEIVSTNYQGFWQQRGWSDSAVVKTMSRIDFPQPGGVLPAGKPTRLAGIAFAGARGIARVEVSMDNGQTWQSATLKPPLSDLSWVLWHLDWTSPRAGQAILTVRAMDGAGQLQSAQETDSLPDGASGYHSIIAKVQS